MNYLSNKYGDPISLSDLFMSVCKYIQTSALKEGELLQLGVELQWDNEISNSHSCPIGGVKNFVRKPGIVMSYPGWKGRLWTMLSNDAKTRYSFTSKMFEDIGIHTGTGGFGAYGNTTIDHFDGDEYEDASPYSWDLKVFSADFPSIQIGTALQLNQDNGITILDYVNRGSFNVEELIDSCNHNAVFTIPLSHEL